ncbi:MAG: transferrin-binding protein-like solute binding protein [Cardiobacteriaceae bacterium]|nr:transferrin-binding protein-like solute binding protein [Cardiobacteriaceae bacterium]
MKLTNLSLAIMVALGAAACGGSGDSTTPQVDPNNTKQPETTPETKPETNNRDDSALVDPTNTHVVDNRDLTKESTVGGLQYIRRDGSNYDRIYNPEKPASATPLLGVSLDEQNPKLTNIVLARRDLDKEDNKAVRAQFAGGTEREPLTSEGKSPVEPSLQIENFQNVDILAGAFKQRGNAKDYNRKTRDDIDVHDQDNIDKSGEFTRERVSHVYTLRYEYKQPFVDYPNVAVASRSDRSLGDLSPTDPRLLPPAPPAHSPTADELMGKADGFDLAAISKSSHAANNGLGDGPKSGGFLPNIETKYGSLDGATYRPDGAYLNAWKNKASDNKSVEVGRVYVPGTATTPSHYTRAGALAADDATLDWTTTAYPQRYPNGGYPRYVAAYPRYPDQPYDERTGNVANSDGGGPYKTNTRYTHEHTFLEQDDFTAIREGKPVRPLKNPVANTWTWDLEQYWTYEKYVQTGTDVNGNPIYAWQQQVVQKTNYDKSTDTDNGATLTGGSTRNWKLDHTVWINPKNQGGGEQGEFRGTNYDGWKEADLTIRFNDDRIWKPGTPGYKPEYEKKYGANLIWWSTQDSAFENWATKNGWDPRARRVDNNTKATGGESSEDLVWANNSGNAKNARDRDLEIQPTGDITNGLIRVGGNRPTLGQELQWKDGVWQDYHKTSTRIFGHYHLAYADQDKREINPVSMNSYSGARSFVAEVQGRLPTATPQKFLADLDSKARFYSIGAEPMTLKKVQYGRVTTNLDLTADGSKLIDNGFLRAPYDKKGTSDSVDNYFFRGVDATTIDEMAALPAEGGATYNGHALMYGLNNDFHGITENVKVNAHKNLPNAFDGSGQGGGKAALGLGNFVEAKVDFGTKKVTGDVYNAWLQNVEKSDVIKDRLVIFEGDIIGNTVIGNADRAYVSGNDKADFRAAFFGSKAEEMGGSFNSVKHDDKYGSAYETGDWGGVFGAMKTSSANTFQGDDGSNTYGGGVGTQSGAKDKPAGNNYDSL